MSNRSRTSRYYDKYAKKYGDSFESVRWATKHCQQSRFEQLALFLPNDNFSCNDVGCGLGDFVDFIKNRGDDNFQYHGYDISKEMIKIARKKYKGIENIYFKQIRDVHEMERLDYTIASGTFGKRLLFKSKKAQISFFFKSLITISKKSKKGFGFNFISDKNEPRFYNGLLHVNKNIVVDFCKKNFGSDIQILENYSKDDVTIWVAV